MENYPRVFSFSPQKKSPCHLCQAKNFKVFLKTTFSPQFVSAHDYEPNIFFSFFESFQNSLVFYPNFEVPTSPFDIRFWTRGFLLVIQFRRQASPLQRELGSGKLCLQRYVSRMTRTFSKSKVLKVFLETTFLHSSCYSDHYESKIFSGPSLRELFLKKNELPD